MPRAFQNPKQVVDEFKKSGEFDRLRRQLLTHFANSDEVRPLMSRVEEIARDKLSSDARLELKSREAAHSEVMQDLERYPIVERAVSDLAVLKDEALLASIEQHVRNIVRGESNDSTRLWNAQPSRSKTDEGEDNDESSDYSENDEPGDDDYLIVTEAEQEAATVLSAGEPLHSHGVVVEPHTPSHTPPGSPHLNQRVPINPNTDTPPCPAEYKADISLAPQTTSPGDFSYDRRHSPSAVRGQPSSDILAGELLDSGAAVDASPTDSSVGNQVESEHRELLTNVQAPVDPTAQDDATAQDPKTVATCVPELDVQRKSFKSPSGGATAQPMLGLGSEEGSLRVRHTQSSPYNSHTHTSPRSSSKSP